MWDGIASHEGDLSVLEKGLIWIGMKMRMTMTLSLAKSTNDS